ncbi:MAG: helix-turn-helix domain-containing protein [Ignavibacteriaceae bacterium]|nr:helix-turn-helix domain-containing protein [Ignavibacteriaceae bacterium]
MKIKKNENESEFFAQLLQSIPEEVKNKVDISMAIATQINSILKRKNISQRAFAELLGKKESEISKWLSGNHNFTTNTLGKIQTVLAEPIISVPIYVKPEVKFVPYQFYTQIGQVTEIDQSQIQPQNPQIQMSDILRITTNNECYGSETFH